MSAAEAYVVGAVRTPIGRRGGGLCDLHPATLLGAAYGAALARSGAPAGEVGQVLTGCVTAAGEQAFNIGRTAWLAAGLPDSVAAATVDAQCGSSQHAVNLAAGLVAAGVEDLVVVGGVESMSRVPLGANRANGPGHPLPPEYSDHHRWATQFEGAQLIAERWGITRDECDELGLRSQQRAAAAWQEGRFDREIVAVGAVTRDEGLRDTSRERLAALAPLVRDDGVHTAGTASQISDGAAALVLASADAVARHGLTPRAVVRHQCLVGVDPETMLTGPIDATRRVLDRAGLTMSDLDVVEINEAFASVVLAWERELVPDPERVNPNGGAIALGHPVGCTGARLVTTALHELERTEGHRALVTMCCGGGLGTATIIERI